MRLIAIVAVATVRSGQVVKRWWCEDFKSLLQTKIYRLGGGAVCTIICVRCGRVARALFVE